MNRRSAIFSATLLLPGCSVGAAPAEIRYQLRAKFLVGARTIEGVTTFRCRYWAPSTHPFAGKGGSIGVAWSEALYVDLAERGMLVGLIGTVPGIIPPEGREYWPGCFRPLDPALEIGYRNLSELTTDALGDRRVEVEMARAMRGEQALPPTHWPVFIHFSDPNEIRTASWVHIPRQRLGATSVTASKTLGEVCGDVASLLSLTVEGTNSPVAEQILTTLPWLTEIQGSPRNPRSGFSRNRDSALHEKLAYGNFKLTGR